MRERLRIKLKGNEALSLTLMAVKPQQQLKLNKIEEMQDFGKIVLPLRKSDKLTSNTSQTGL